MFSSLCFTVLCSHKLETVQTAAGCVCSNWRQLECRMQCKICQLVCVQQRAHSRKQLPFLMNVHFETVCNDGSSRSSPVCDNNCAHVPLAHQRGVNKKQRPCIFAAFLPPVVGLVMERGCLSIHQAITSMI